MISSLLNSYCIVASSRNMNIAINSRILLPKIQSPHLDAAGKPDSKNMATRGFLLKSVKKWTHAWKTELNIALARVILELSLLAYTEQADCTTIKRRINYEASYSIPLYFLTPPTLRGNRGISSLEQTSSNCTKKNISTDFFKSTVWQNVFWVSGMERFAEGSRIMVSVGIISHPRIRKLRNWERLPSKNQRKEVWKQTNKNLLQTSLE